MVYKNIKYFLYVKELTIYEAMNHSTFFFSKSIFVLERSAAILLAHDLLYIIWTGITWGIRWHLEFFDRMKYGQVIEDFFGSVEKGRRKDTFNIGRFLKKDGFIGFPWQCNDFYGHSILSKMVIEFFSLGLTTFELQQFVYACIVLPEFWLVWVKGLMVSLKCLLENKSV